MEAPESGIDLNTLVTRIVEAWRSLSPDEQQDEDIVLSLLNFSDAELTDNERTYAIEEFYRIIEKEGYSGSWRGSPLSETRRIITRCILEEFISV